jgi:hypothetical protein
MPLRKRYRRAKATANAQKKNFQNPIALYRKIR